MNKLFLNFAEKIYKIFKIKIIFFVPKNIDTIILDFQTGYFYDSFFKNKIILHTRGEKYYFKIFISTILEWFVSKKSFNQIYIINCIKEINPKFLITFTDYNLFFLSLKKIFPNKKLIIFQSHTRSYQTLLSLTGLNYKKFKKFNVDYIFIWGKRFKDYYNYFLNGKIIISGNMKNNYFKKKYSKNDRKIVYISQFRLREHSGWTGSEFNKQKVNKFKNDFYNNLKEFVTLNKLKLYVLGYRLDPKEAVVEKSFYLKIFGKKCIFLKKNNIFDSYINSQEMNNFVTITSSLGLELIARGKRVAFIKKENVYKDKFKDDIFKIRTKGPNWSNNSSKRNVFKILNFLISSKSNFNYIYKNYFKQFIIYDKGNKIIKNELKKIGLNLAKKK